jgi:proline-specific peptidase
VREGFIEVPGGRVWYRREGADGVPLVCLHGGPGFPHDYIANLFALADERPVLMYDQLGCGRSDRPQDPSLWRLVRFVEELHVVRTSLGIEEMHLLGQSWGGLLAIEYALAYPAAIRSLTLASAVVSVPDWLGDAQRLLDGLPAETLAVIRDHEARGFTACLEYQAAVLEYWRLHLCRLRPWPDELERAFSGFGTTVYEAMWGPSEFTCTGTLRGYDATPRLEQLSMPTWLTCGRHDEATPEANERYAALLPAARLTVFEDSSHTAHLEEAGRYRELLSAFLDDVEMRAPARSS